MANMNTALEKGPSKRIAYIDALRGLAMFLVVFQHVYTFSTTSIKISDSILSEIIRTVFLHLFFFVSGYLAYKSVPINKYIGKIKTKFIQLIIPTVIFSLVYSLLCYNIISNVIHKGWATYWFTVALFTMFLIYVLIDLIMHIFKINSNEKLSSIIYVVFAIILIVLGVKVPYLCPSLEIKAALGYFPCFIFGILAKKHNVTYEKIISNNIINGIVVILYIVALIIIFNKDVSESLFLLSDSFAYKLFIVFCNLNVSYFGLFVIVSFFYRMNSYFEKSGMISKTICFFGQRTLEIYMIHYFLLPKFSFGIREYFETYYNPVLEIIVVGGLAVGIMGLSTLIGELIRNSDILSRYMLGVTQKKKQ